MMSEQDGSKKDVNDELEDVEEEAELLVRDVMTRDVRTVKPNDHLTDVARLMIEEGISGCPVIADNGEVIGVISEGDLLKRWQELKIPSFIGIFGGLFPVGSLAALEKQIREIAALQVSEVMSRPAITAIPEWTVAQAAQAMMRNRVNRLPVIDGRGRLVGIITRADLVRTLAGGKRSLPPADSR